CRATYLLCFSFAPFSAGPPTPAFCTLSLHDALPICTTIAEKPLRMRGTVRQAIIAGGSAVLAVDAESRTFVNVLDIATATVRLKDRKSTRLNSSHDQISYAVFCLKKKNRHELNQAAP